jgi:hypothetical protein
MDINQHVNLVALATWSPQTHPSLPPQINGKTERFHRSSPTAGPSPASTAAARSRHARFASNAPTSGESISTAVRPSMRAARVPVGVRRVVSFTSHGRHQGCAGAEHAERPLDGVAADGVEHDVDVLDHVGEVDRRVADHLVGAGRSSRRSRRRAISGYSIVTVSSAPTAMGFSPV